MLLPILALLVASSPAAHAKDLRNRIAVGGRVENGQVAQVSLRYGTPAPDAAINLQIEGIFGIDAEESTSTAFVAGGRVLYGVVAEDNLNLWVGAGGSLVEARGASTVRLQPAFGVDAFPFGLENLGLTIECGLNLDVGDAPGAATMVGFGAHYWF